MHLLFFFLALTGAYPLGKAWRANRRTSLIQAMHWAILAWLGWLAAFLLGEEAQLGGMNLPRYLALCLTGCAGVAVLGARRPHVGAWNFVVLGLLSVMVLPLAESLLAGAGPLGPLHQVFLGATLAVGVLNYLPTRLAPAALLLASALGEEMILSADIHLEPTWRKAMIYQAQFFLVLVPWSAWWALNLFSEKMLADFDQCWLFFRNRFGLVWGQRVREQFNHAADNAGWPVYLSWRGLRRPPGESQESPAPEELLETLKALLKRFEEEPGPAKSR